MSGTVEIGERVPAELAQGEVLDLGGGELRLGSLFEGRTAVLVFLRHFGCIGCSRHVTELSPRIAELDRLGVAVVFVGNGSPEQAEDFAKRHRLHDRAVTLVTDPTLRTHAAAQLRRGWWGALGPRAFVNQARAVAAGYSLGSIEGDAQQQGGALVVDPEGTVVLHRASRAIADNVSGSDLVGAAMRVVARRAAREGRKERL